MGGHHSHIQIPQPCPSFLREKKLHGQPKEREEEKTGFRLLFPFFKAVNGNGWETINTLWCLTSSTILFPSHRCGSKLGDHRIRSKTARVYIWHAKVRAMITDHPIPGGAGGIEPMVRNYRYALTSPQRNPALSVLQASYKPLLESERGQSNTFP